ncbi:MAG: HEAT repeat domain-containing protein [Planctomycetota bacterium]
MRSVFCALTLGCAALAVAQDSPLDQALAKQVNLTFRRTPLVHVLDALQERSTGLNLVADPAVLARPLFVSTTGEETSVRALLEQVVEEQGLETTRWAGALVVHLPGEGPQGTPSTGKGNKVLEDPVSVTFMNLSLLETVDRLKRYPIQVELSTRARVAVQRSGVRMRLRLRALPLRQVLDHVARQAGLEWTLTGESGVEFDAPKTGGGLDLTVDTIDRVRDPQEDLPKLLEDLKKPGMRSGAARRLLAIGPDAAQPLADLLESEEDPDVTRAALEVLGQVGSNDQHEVVLKIFRDPRRSLEERVAAGLALGNMQAVDAIPSLIAALDHSWFSVSETARQALVKIKGPVTEKLAGYYKREVQKPDGREGLIYRGLLIFGEIGDETGTKVLLEALATNDGPREVSIKHHAAIGLGMTGNPEVVEPLIEAMTLAEDKRQFQVVNYIGRSLTWLTDAENPPRAVEWRAWWEKEEARIRARNARAKELREAGLDVEVKPDLGDLKVPKPGK